MYYTCKYSESPRLLLYTPYKHYNAITWTGMYYNDVKLGPEFYHRHKLVRYLLILNRKKHGNRTNSSTKTLPKFKAHTL